MNRDKVLVYADWDGLKQQRLGTIYAEKTKGREVYSFEYDADWLKNMRDNVALDPDLFLYAGRQYVPLNKAIFGVFADSCPDRWGRMLLQRRELYEARKEERRPRSLTELDYLLGVYDAARMGALRFKTVEQGYFLAADDDLATPPWTTLRTLENMSMAFEAGENGFSERWLLQLLAPGSSLGGARPKATVQAPDGSLWVAKFPSKHDEHDTGAWEMVVHDLACECGLNVPEAKIEVFSKHGSTFLSKRFDRKDNERIHFSSAMTLLGKTDGADFSDGTSYLDIASFIRSNGVSPAKDLAELWRRVVFSIAVGNTDDHLRNHGFLFARNGWRLSPMFDVNPDVYGDNLSLNITENDASMRFEVAAQAAVYFGINSNIAARGISEIKSIVENRWEKLARQYGLGRSAIEFMRPAFDMRLK